MQQGLKNKLSFINMKTFVLLMLQMTQTRMGKAGTDLGKIFSSRICDYELTASI